eukprot:TRINITY_DN8011_c1_g1_i1.p1 TRINITY_DN8011_c1_g1~~TRINITY_DN8011_c1_g1_i1.p1  ORF type:complete len:138 (+),score=39.31 TRINITY_DN8011_c1_g1_i1:49-414(+)
MKTTLLAIALVAWVCAVRGEDEEAVKEPEFFYYNSVTKESVWDKPAEMGHISTEEEHKGATFYVVDGVSQWEKPHEWDWEVHNDKESGKDFYHNRHSGESTWELPASMAWGEYKTSENKDP